MLEHPPHNMIHPATGEPSYDWEQEWYACVHPERPHDDYAAYWSKCPGCVLAFLAALKQGHGPRMTTCVDLRTPADPAGHRTYTWAEALAVVAPPN